MFQTTKKDYFKLKNIDIINIKLRYYFSSQLLYHILIITPPILIYWLAKWKTITSYFFLLLLEKY